MEGPDHVTRPALAPDRGVGRIAVVYEAIHNVENPDPIGGPGPVTVTTKNSLWNGDATVLDIQVRVLEGGKALAQSRVVLTAGQQLMPHLTSPAWSFRLEGVAPQLATVLEYTTPRFELTTIACSGPIFATLVLLQPGVGPWVISSYTIAVTYQLLGEVLERHN